MTVKRDLIKAVCVLMLGMMTISGCSGKKASNEVIYHNAAGNAGEAENAEKADINGDGSEDTVEYRVNTDEYDAGESLDVIINGKEHHLLDGYYFYPDAGLDCFWFMSDADKECYLYIQYVSDNDYRDVAVYRYKDDETEYIADLGGAVKFGVYDDKDEIREITFTDTKDFLVGKREQKFGTSFLTERCHIGENGCPEQTEKYLYYATGSDAEITADKDIPCMYLKDEKTEDGTPDMIEKGEKVIAYRTDGDTFIDLKVDGAEGLYRLYTVQDEEGNWMVTGSDGVGDKTLLTECFEGLLFAG
ncbi:MAG: hypothetical protein K6A90_07255 [Lachnospiraceae bacterium]|nr:hypothetical protein [Lachnospiraceae bacterium]